MDVSWLGKPFQLSLVAKHLQLVHKADYKELKGWMIWQVNSDLRKFVRYILVAIWMTSLNFHEESKWCKQVL